LRARNNDDVLERGESRNRHISILCGCFVYNSEAPLARDPPVQAVELSEQRRNDAGNSSAGNPPAGGSVPVTIRHGQSVNASTGSPSAGGSVTDDRPAREPANSSAGNPPAGGLVAGEPQHHAVAEGSDDQDEPIPDTGDRTVAEQPEDDRVNTSRDVQGGSDRRSERDALDRLGHEADCAVDDWRELGKSS
jgi:hypothetical protein